MRRLLTYLLAVPVMAATVGAAPAANTPKMAVATNSPRQFKKAPLSSSKQKAKQSKPYQVGTASWYGRQFHGKTTASGTRFKQPDRELASTRRGDEPARRMHEPKRATESARGKLGFQVRQVPIHQGLYIGIGAGRHGTRVLAQLGNDFAG